MDSAATNVAPHIASALAYFIAGLSLSSLMRTGQKIASSRVCSAASLRSECVLCTLRARSSLNLLGLSPKRFPNTMNTLTSGILTNANVRFPPKADIQDLPAVALPIGRHVTFSRQLIHRPPIVELAVGQLSPDKLVNE